MHVRLALSHHGVGAADLTPVRAWSCVEEIATSLQCASRAPATVPVSPECPTECTYYLGFGGEAYVGSCALVLLLQDTSGQSESLVDCNWGNGVAWPYGNRRGLGRYSAGAITAKVTMMHWVGRTR